MLFVAVTFAGAAFSAWPVPDGQDPPSSAPCETADDCPFAMCYDIACGQGVCQYARRPGHECCLSDEDCCPYASDTQIAYCSKSCTCRFFPALQYQCTRDEHCDDLVSGAVCRAEGACQVPFCGRGFCSCANTTGIDVDGDGVPCPDDCDDANPLVSELRRCWPDADGDRRPDCTGECASVCVEPGRGCPAGYVTAEGPVPDTRVPSEQDVTGEACEEGSTPEATLCDCCDLDSLVYPGSPYAAAQETACGGYDYTCDGQDTGVACCGEPSLPGRAAWVAEDACTSAQDTCGGCGTGVQNVPLVFDGWACEGSCPEDGAAFPGEACPALCAGECECVSEGTGPPPVGSCARRVTGCVDTGEGVYSDKTECCVAASL